MNTLKNTVRLTGFLAKDPEVMEFGNGRKKVRLLLVTQDNDNSKPGEKNAKSQFHTLAAWGKHAELAQKFLYKGRQIAIHGRLIYSSYMDNDLRKYFSEVLIQNIAIIDTNSRAAS